MGVCACGGGEGVMSGGNLQQIFFLLVLPIFTVFHMVQKHSEEHLHVPRSSHMFRVELNATNTTKLQKNHHTQH